MTRHDDKTRLRHMLDHAKEAVEMIRGNKRSDLNSDRKLNLALVRLVEIVGEAGARVSDRGRELATDIPWENIVGMRNRIVHGYDAVDLDILWDVVESDLPPLIASLERALDE